jgi:predicted Zn-dependent peptidase
MLLSYILGDVTGSRLYYALVEQALADEAHMSCSPMDGSGAMLTFVSCDPENAGRVLEIVTGEFRKFLEKGPSSPEMEAARNKMATSATIKSEQPMGRLPGLGLEWVYRCQYNPIEAQIERIYRITPDEVVDVAKWCRLTEPTILSLGPLEEYPS